LYSRPELVFSTANDAIVSLSSELSLHGAAAMEKQKKKKKKEGGK